MISKKYNAKIISDILGGLSPEELSKEPSNIIDPMFDTLLELATNDQQNTDEEIRALASACLLSLSVAYGDTGEEIDSSFSVPVRKRDIYTLNYYRLKASKGSNNAFSCDSSTKRTTVYKGQTA